jgi:hypothetical protein
MTVLWRRRPAHDLSRKELLGALEEHQRALLEIDAQIHEWEVEATPVSNTGGKVEAVNDPHSVKLITTRKAVAESVEEIRLELQTRKHEEF